SGNPHGCQVRGTVRRHSSTGSRFPSDSTSSLRGDGTRQMTSAIAWPIEPPSPPLRPPPGPSPRRLRRTCSATPTPLSKEACPPPLRLRQRGGRDSRPPALEPGGNPLRAAPVPFP